MNTEQTLLEKNIRKRMEDAEPRIKSIGVLLEKIAKTLGEKDPKRFAKNNNPNFSKMMKDVRRFNNKYIEPLELILKSSFRDLKEKELYKETKEVCDALFQKNIRYYALKNDPKEYEQLNDLRSEYGDLIIRNNDEYGKSFVDYLVMYQRIEGIRYLVERHGFHYEYVTRNYIINDEYTSAMLFSVDEKELSKLIITKGDKQLFTRVYGNLFNEITDSINSFRYLGSYLLNQDFFYEQIMMNPALFDALTSEDATGPITMPKINTGIVGRDDEKVPILNPIINKCLNVALKDIANYKCQAEEIIEAGIKRNRSISTNLVKPLISYSIDKDGFLLEGQTIVTSVIYTSVTSVGDKEIDVALIKLNESLSSFNLKR